MNGNHRRLVLHEYGSSTSYRVAAEHLGIPVPRLMGFLESSSQRIGNALSLSSPFSLERNSFRPTGFAGVLRLSASVELEVVPKFLSAEDRSWRDDFIAIANLVRFGAVLHHEDLPQAISQSSSLADVLGYVMVKLFDKNARTPLRLYRRRTWTDFGLDGIADEESLALPGPDGYTQTGLLFDRNNPFNRVIRDAMLSIAPDVRDNGIQQQLVRRVHRLSPQTEPMPRVNRPLPTRCSGWQQLYELSWGILNGKGVRYGSLNEGGMPGFVLKTADAWEALMRVASASSLREYRVHRRGFVLGAKQRLSLGIALGSQTPVSVYPDIVVETRDDGKVVALLDAKYKSSSPEQDSRRVSISSSDVYESMAFMRAAGCTRLVLLFPQPTTVPMPGLGDTNVFERVQVDGLEVIGAFVTVQGIAASHGFRTFTSRLRQTLAPVAEVGAASP